MGNKANHLVYSIMLLALFSIVSFSLLSSQNAFAPDGDVHVDALVRDTPTSRSDPDCHGTYDEWVIFPTSIADSCDAVRDDDGSGNFLLDTSNGVARFDASKDSSWKFNGVGIPGAVNPADVSVTFTAWLKRIGTTETDTALLYEEARSKKKQAEFDIVPPIPLASTIGAFCPDGSPNVNAGFCPYSWTMLTNPVDGSFWTPADVLNWDGSFGLRNKQQQFSTIEGAGVLITVNFPDSTPPIGTLVLNAGVEKTTSEPVDVTTATCDDEGASGCASAALYFDTNGDGLPDGNAIESKLVGDGDVQLSIDPFDPVELDNGRGDYTVLLVLCDVAGNCNNVPGPVPASTTDLVKLFATFSVTSDPNPAFGEWDIVTTSFGTSWTNANVTAGDLVKYYADAPGSSTLDTHTISTTSSSDTGSLIYPQGSVGDHTPSACLVDSASVVVKDINNVDLCDSTSDNSYESLAHDTEFRDLQVSSAPDGNDASAFGTLFDLDADQGVDDSLTVTFALSTATAIPPATTGTTTITGASAIVNDVLRLPPPSSPGATINTPILPTYAILGIEDMNGNNFTINFIIDGDQYEFKGDPIEDPSLQISLLLSGGDPSEPGSGISQISIADVENGATFGLERFRILTAEQDTIADITFDAAGLEVESVMSFSGGGFLTRFMPPGLTGLNDEAHVLTASFAGTPDFNMADDVMANMIVVANTGAPTADPTETSTTTIVADLGTGVLSQTCEDGEDDDADGLCNAWEDDGGVPFDRDGDGSTTGTADGRYPILNADRTAKNLLYEVDYMGDPHSLRPAAIGIVKNAFSAEGITLDIVLDDSIPHVEEIVMWTDNGADSDSDGDADNDDFEAIKRQWYGDSTLGEQASLDSTGTPAWSSATRIIIDGVTITTPGVSYDSSGTLVTSPSVTPTQGTITLIVDASTTTAATLSGGSVFVAAGSTAGITFQPSTIIVNPTDDPLTHEVTMKLNYLADDAGTYTLGRVKANVANSGTNSGTPVVTDGIASTTLLDAKKHAYRYILSGHGMGGPSGWAELLGNDIGLFLGEGFTGNRNFGDGSTHVGTRGNNLEQSASLLHEMGHNLNLKHGGPATLLGSTTLETNADINCKPLYLSVMSYSRIYSYFFSSTSLHTTDFSHGDFVGTDLDEDHLNENLSVTSPEDETVLWGGEDGDGVLTIEGKTINTVDTDFDWDHDGGDQDADVAVDINDFGIQGCVSQGGETQQDYDDWANLDFIFTDTPSGSFDAPAARFIAEVNKFILDAQKINNAFFFGPIPPLELESIQKAGTNHPIKVAGFFETLDDNDNPINVEIVGNEADGDVVAVATIVVTRVTGAGAPQVVCEGTMEWQTSAHFHFDCKSKKNMKDTQLNVSIFLAHADNPTKMSLLTTDPPLLDANGDKATMIINLTK